MKFNPTTVVTSARVYVEFDAEAIHLLRECTINHPNPLCRRAITDVGLIPKIAESMGRKGYATLRNPALLILADILDNHKALNRTMKTAAKKFAKSIAVCIQSIDNASNRYQMVQ